MVFGCCRKKPPPPPDEENQEYPEYPAPINTRPERGKLKPYIVIRQSDNHYPPVKQNIPISVQPPQKQQAVARAPLRQQSGAGAVQKQYTGAREPQKKRKRKKARQKRCVCGFEQQNSVIRSRQYPAIVVDALKKSWRGLKCSEILEYFATMYNLEDIFPKVERVLNWMNNKDIIAQRPCGRWMLLKEPKCGCWARPKPNSPKSTPRRKRKKRRNTNRNVQNVTDPMENCEELEPSSIEPSSNVYYEPDEYVYQPVRRYEDRRKRNYNLYDSVRECQPGSSRDYEYQPVRRYTYKPLIRPQYKQQSFRTYQHRNQDSYKIGRIFHK